LEHLDASRPCVIEQQSVKSPSIHKHALRLWIGSLTNLPIPIHQDRLYRERAGLLKDITSANGLKKSTHTWCQGFTQVFSGKLRSLDKDDVMAQGSKSGGKRTACRSTPNHTDVGLDRLHEGLERERIMRYLWDITSFSVG
jgi:hypothetical protein